MLAVEKFEEVRLLFQRVVAGVDEDFGDTGVWRLESGIFVVIKKKDVFIFVVDVEEILRQFKNITANAGELGGIHSAVDAYFHGTILAV